MSAEFVPFSVSQTDGIRLQTSPRTQVVADGKSAAAFLPLTRSGPQEPASPHAHDEPTVSVERDGDRVTRIKVQCPCGNVIELACEY
jgi:hypothetical protein